MRIAVLVLAVSLLAGVAGGQTMTLPVGFLSTDGNGATAFPFNNTNDHIWQWHYANSNFAAITGPITITGVSIRASAGTSTVAAFSFPSVDISIGSATTGYMVGQHDLTFANNVCSDLTLVRSGAWTGGPVAPTGGSTAPFFSLGSGPFITPFVFDPTSGKDLIVQIVKCGTTATLGSSIDGSSAGPGLNGGNRYGDQGSCSATTFSFNNNEFVPIVKIDFVAGGTPGICLTEYQQNQGGASLTVNGAADPGGAVSITALLATNASASIDMTSTNLGNPWDLVFNVGVSTVPLSGAGFALPGSQVVNMDFSAPGISFLNGGFAGPGFANISPVISISVPLTISAQLVLIDPSQPSGVALSHAIDVIFVPCGGSNFDNLPTGLGVAPPSWSNPSSGTGWTVHAGGTASVGTGPTAAASVPNYAYCETSGAGATATFVMDTCAIDITPLTAFTLDFSLSRIGATIGTLTILQDDGSGAFATMIGTFTGADPAQSQGGVEWSSESIPFLPTSVLTAFRFSYTAGGSFTGDLAVDDITVN